MELRWLGLTVYTSLCGQHIIIIAYTKDLMFGERWGIPPWHTFFGASQLTGAVPASGDKFTSNIGKMQPLDDVLELYIMYSDVKWSPKWEDMLRGRTPSKSVFRSLKIKPGVHRVYKIGVTDLILSHLKTRVVAGLSTWKQKSSITASIWVPTNIRSRVYREGKYGTVLTDTGA